MDERTLRVLEYHKIIQMLAQCAKSSPGKDFIMALKPVSHESTIRRWLDETSEAESITAIEGSGFISEFPDITFALKKAEIGSILSPKDLLLIAQVLGLGNSVVQRMNQHKEKTKLEIIPALIQGIKPQQQLLRNIHRCIESEEHISDQASPALANIRRQMAKAHERIKERLNSFIHSPQTQKFLQEPIITMRNDRYVVPVKQEHRPSVQGLIHDQSSSGATVFIEPMAVVEANNEIRQLLLKEEDEIERILAQLTAEVAMEGEDISSALQILIQLDIIFAKGSLSLAMRCICPRLINEQSVKIIRGRHPLIDKDMVVPISLELGRAFDTMVITGPNTGGKTVTLKTAGLFVLMVQTGLHIPADFGTEMGIFENVYADIGDEQSIEQSLSTFSSHMTNIVKIVSKVDKGDLVLFDELGAGTDPTEGAALAMSILDYLHMKHIRTMATTHYSELKMYALTHEGVENASVEFDVETLRPTYRLLTGIPGKSNAFEISRRLGLMEDFILGAKAYISQEDVRFEDIIGNIEKNRLAAEQERQLTQKALVDIEHLKQALEQERAQLTMDKSKQLKKAREEAKKIIQDAKAEADQVIKELQQMAKETEEKDRNRAIEEARKKIRNTLDKINSDLSISTKTDHSLIKPPKSLQLGETVYLVNLDQKGQVLSIPDSSGEVVVQVGIMKVNVHLSNLRRAEDNLTMGAQSNKKVKPRAVPVALEVDIRGQNAEEAILVTDRYLDDAFLAGLNEVTIIHGKGTGVLRSAIHQHLKMHSHVASYRLGKYGEGEAGVTIVILK